MSYPGQQNEFAKKAKRMKKNNIPLQLDNRNYGTKRKARIHTFDIVSTSGNGKMYGTKTIVEKKLTFREYLLSESNDTTALPDQVISEIKSLIKKGARDLAQQWQDARHLTNKAYEVANVRQPRPDEKGAWKQYEELLAYSVSQLAATRGKDGKWRKSDVMYTEATEAFNNTPMAKRRFFVSIPGEQATEVTADNMDDIIEQISAKIRASRDVHGSKVRIESRDEKMAKLSVWVDDVKREEIVVREIS